MSFVTVTTKMPNCMLVIHWSNKDHDKREDDFFCRNYKVVRGMSGFHWRPWQSASYSCCSLSSVVSYIIFVLKNGGLYLTTNPILKAKCFVFQGPMVLVLLEAEMRPLTHALSWPHCRYEVAISVEEHCWGRTLCSQQHIVTQTSKNFFFQQ